MDTSKSFSNIQIVNTNSSFSLLFSKPQNYEFENIFGDMKLTAKYLKNDVSSFEVSGMKLEDLWQQCSPIEVPKAREAASKNAYNIPPFLAS